MGLLGDIFRALAGVLCGVQKPTDNEIVVPQLGKPQPEYPAAEHGVVSVEPARRQHPQYHQGHHEQHPVQDVIVPPSYPPAPPPHKPAHEHRPYVDQNQINQQNTYYTSLRSQANASGDQMAKCFEESHQAYNRRDGALAKQLSEEGKRHKSEMERLNKEASEWIFRENNKDSQPGEIDLHGLYVKEAIEGADEAIQAARQRGDSEIRLIVGKGLHSTNRVAKLKPAIEELMQKHQLVAQLDPENSGVLIVNLRGEGRGTGRSLDPDEITRRLEKPDSDCVVM